MRRPSPVDSGELLSQHIGHGRHQIRLWYNASVAGRTDVTSWILGFGKSSAVKVEARPMVDVVAGQSAAFPAAQALVAERADGIAVTVLEPLQIRLDDALQKIGFQLIISYAHKRQK